MSKRRAGNLSVAVAYIRSSTDEQKLGPEAQRAAIVAWAAVGGVSVVEWHTDAGVSGGAELEQRPGLMAALAGVKAHRAGVLIVAKRDRLARDVAVAAIVERAALASGARVACADGVGNGDSPADQFMRTIIDGAAQYERSLIRGRTRAALKAKRDRGERVGQVPYGFRLSADGAHLERDLAEQAVIAQVLTLRGAGLSIRAIVDECALAGLVSRSGRPFGVAQIHRIIAA